MYGCHATARDSRSGAAAEARRNGQPRLANANNAPQGRADVGTVSPSATPQPVSDPNSTAARALVGDQSGDANAANHKPPKIVVPIRKLDFGRQAADATVVRSLPVRNTGAGDLTLDSVESSCGCTTVDFPKAIGPGKTGAVKIRIETGAVPGLHMKTVTIRSNDPDEPALQIQLLLTVKSE